MDDSALDNALACLDDAQEWISDFIRGPENVENILLDQLKELNDRIEELKLDLECVRDDIEGTE